MPLVKAAEEKGNSGHGTALKKAEEEACGVEALVGSDESAAERAKSESENEEGDPYSSTNPLEKYVGGNFDSMRPKSVKKWYVRLDVGIVQ